MLECEQGGPMEKKLKIMVDMDEVICKGGFLYLVNSFLGTNYKEEDFKNYHMQDVIEDKKSFFQYFLTKNSYDYCDLLPNVDSVLKELNEIYDVFIGTAYLIHEIPRESGILLLQKHNYLQKYLPFIHPYQYVFVNNKSVLNCEIRIDDRVINLDGADTKLLFRAYHNIDLEGAYLKEQNIERVNDWNEVGARLLRR